MKHRRDIDTPQADGKTRQRSAEQRNIVAPTPRDIRDKAEDERDKARSEDEPEDSVENGS
ncbi:hypothetical protein ACIBKX_37065 [Streptomyces sp. NPDC050658]|uniref:hypothetical protein n=1 Tax=unclassified Streptomyces TaxID=2593676 RepID=UPI00341C8CF2